MNLQVVISGVNGFLGSATFEHLASIGIDVYALSKPGLGSEEEPNSTFKRLRDSGLDPGFTFIAGGWSGVANTSRNDETLQRQSLDNFKIQTRDAIENGCRRIIGIGTQAELEMSVGKVGPKSPYAANKLLAGEFLGQQASKNDVEYCWARVFSVYGPGMLKTWLPWLIVESLRTNSPLDLGSCSQLWGFLHIEDYTRAVELLATTELVPANTIDVGYPATRSLRVQIEEVFERFGVPDLINFGERGNSYSSVPDLDALLRLGWEPRVDFLEGITRLLDVGK